MSFPDRCPDPLPFDVTNIYVRYTYLDMLDILLGDIRENIPRRMHDMEEMSSHVIGKRTAALVAARAIMDDVDIENPRVETIG